MVVVLDSEYVDKGITEWSPKWRRHHWRTSGGEVGHKDLWEQIPSEREVAGELLRIYWVPSHSGVKGNGEVDALAEEGRLAHQHNHPPLPKRRRVEPLWEDLGLEEMSLGGREKPVTVGHPMNRDRGPF